MNTAIPDIHILVVDDDDRLRDLLKSYLQENGYFVSTAANTTEADEVLCVFAVDLMILDVMMPKETGLDYALRLRQRGKVPPILMLTARAEAEERVSGLEAGVADYLTKPFTPRELVLRMENILRQVQHQQGQRRQVRFGPYRFDLDTGHLLHQDTHVYLTSSEVECLRILAEHNGAPVGRETLAELAGGIGNERSVDVQINRLRKKIETNPSAPVYIQTVRNAGYVLHTEQIA